MPPVELTGSPVQLVEPPPALRWQPERRGQRARFRAGTQAELLWLLAELQEPPAQLRGPSADLRGP
eukprot:858241-Pyramimonas_sp.AAC.2